MMARSFSLVDTGSPFTLQVQAASQRAGHTLAGKFRKTVGLGQSQIRLFEISTVYQIIGLRHQIVQRTAGSHTANHAAGLAEGNAALHAARSLLSLFFQLQRSFELMEMLDPLKGSFRCGSLPFIL